MNPQQIVDLVLHVTGKRYRRRDILEASGPTGYLPRKDELVEGFWTEVFPRDSIRVIVSRLGYLPESFEPYLPS